MDPLKRDERSESRVAVRVGIALVALAALYCAFAAADIQLFVLQAKPATNLANPPRVQKLVWLEIILMATALLMARVGFAATRPGSPQQQLFARSSVTAQLLCGLLTAYVLLVYYPLPPHGHHTEKALLASGILLLWSGLAVVRPTILTFNPKRVFASLKVVLVNILLFIAVGELTFRLADSVIASQGFFGGKQTPAHLTPHVPVHGSIGYSNSQGFRDRERAVDRGQVRTRVLAIGDSQTYGAGVTYDEAFPTLLEKRLQQVEPSGEVMNLGVSGWEPPEELHLLKVYGLQFRPDIVLMNFFVGNDIIRRRGAYWEQPIVVGGQSYYVHATGNVIHDAISPDRWFLYHDLNYVFQVGMVHLKSWRRQGSVEAADLPITLRSRSEYLQELDERTDIYLVREPKEIQLQWDKTLRTLAEFKQVLDERGIRMVLVLLPDHVQVDQQLRQEFLAARGEDPSQFDFQKPQHMLKEWGERNGVRTIDLLPQFREAAPQEALYFSTDLHITAAGHRLVSEGVWPALLSSLSISPSRTSASHGQF
jgi:acetyltransferase AlgX (SGNH hydrolase-like protein)